MARGSEHTVGHGLQRDLEHSDHRGYRRVRRHRADPGTLTVFAGRNTAHRVTPTIGERDRIIAVFSYYERPGVLFTAAERVGFYGRS